MGTTRKQTGAPWSRTRLLATLGAVVAVGLTVVTAGVVAVVSLLMGGSEQPNANPGTEGSPTTAEELLAQPMVSVAPSAMLPAEPDLHADPPRMVVPTAAAVGSLDVPTGFPQTAEGALGQLAAIDGSVLESMDLSHARDVYQQWSEPTAMGFAQWPVAHQVKGFLKAAENGSAKPTTTSVDLTPAGALLKGSTADGEHVVCVLYRVTITDRAQARFAYAHCEQMGWRQDRWVIASPRPAAEPPKVWPGTADFARAGWSRWVQAGEHDG